MTYNLRGMPSKAKGRVYMDKLFTYETYHMFEQLADVEEEMVEDSYHDCKSEIEDTADNARHYIESVFEYIKKYYRPEECTVLSVMKELYRIALTGEYAYLQDFDEIGSSNDVFEHVKEKSGCRGMLYAIRLLRYYYMLKEKRHHSRKTWEDINNVYMKIYGLASMKKQANKNSNENELSEDEFIQALRSHMDKYMVGQDVLKKKLCTVLYQWKYYNVRTTLLMIGPSGSGKNHMIETIRSFPGLGFPVISYDCSSLTPNGFTGADVSEIYKKIRQVCSKPAISNRMSRNADKEERCIVFLDEVDKIINFNHDSRGESVNALVQQQLLSSLAGTETIEGVDTSKVLFILGGAFPRINDLKKEKGMNSIGFNGRSDYKIELGESLRDQIIAIGGEVEFVGRIEDIVEMSKLTRDDLKSILMDENIGAFSRKKKIFQKSGLSLDIDEDTVDAIVDLIEKEDAGARSVKNIINQFADSQYFYDMKVGGYDSMRIHKGMLKGEAPIFTRGGGTCEKSIRNS